MTSRTPIITAVSVIAISLIAGCGSAQSGSSPDTSMHAGPNEPTFAQAYAPDLKLPMAADRFEDMLKSRGLKYDVKEGPDPSSAMPLPSKASGVDRTNLSQCIEIYGKRNDVDHSMEVFRAYVNKRSEVFYIENAFVYTGT